MTPAPLFDRSARRAPEHEIRSRSRTWVTWYNPWASTEVIYISATPNGPRGPTSTRAEAGFATSTSQ